MRVVESSELSNYKVLPFDLFNESKSKILTAGEVLTPGKLIMLKNYVRVYAEDFRVEKPEHEKEVDGKQNNTRVLNFSYESLDTDEFDTVVNKEACLKTETQVRIKYFYKKIFELFKQGYYDDAVLKLQSLVNLLMDNHGNW